MLNSLHVSFIADMNYLRHLAVAGRSVSEACRATPVTIHVVAIGIDVSERTKLAASWSSDTVDVQFHDWDPAQFKGWQTGEYFTTSVYARLLLPELVGVTGRLVSLDCDMVVLRDLVPLLAIDLAQSPVAAVREPYTPTVSWRRGLSNWAREGIAPETPYFNSGLMVIDTERWRERRVTEAALAYGRKYLATMVGRDEECLNAALRGDWTELDQEWNAGPYWRLARRRTGAYADILDRRRVVHYQGIDKPWLAWDPDDRGDSRLYYEHLDRTAWRGWRP
ncbi:glycosyltransferase family 8 protein [Actinoplanes sp. CA-054009]